MSVLDAPLRTVTLRIIEKFGGTATLKKQGVGTYNAQTGATTPVDSTVWTLKATPPESFNRREINGSTIIEGDFRTLVAAKNIPVIPEVGMIFTWSGVDYRVKGVSPITSGQEVAAYQLSCGK